MQMPDPETTGAKIGKYTKYQREKRNWSLSHFAGRSSLTSSFLLRLENGEYATVKYSVIQKIAHGFEMTVRSLLWKCQLIEEEDPGDLPSVGYYLKEKFQFPPSAIEDVKLFLDFIHKKYKKEIVEMKKAHQQYWKN